MCEPAHVMNTFTLENVERVVKPPFSKDAHVLNRSYGGWSWHSKR